MQAGADADAALIDASRAGDRAAFAKIIERYQRAVYAVSLSGVGDRTLSDDVTQDTFVIAWRRLGDLRNTERLPAWLCGIARNLARDARKREHRDRSLQLPEPAEAATPYDALTDVESERLVASALDGVPATYREPLVMFYVEERKVEDVARALGISARTANKRLSRGRQYLADRVATIVERGVARRGPKADLAASVLAAIGILAPAAHADASPLATKGSMMSKLAIAALLTATAGGGGLLLAGIPAQPSSAPALQASRTTAVPGSSTTARPRTVPAASAPQPTRQQAPDVRPPADPAAASQASTPDCVRVAEHLGKLSMNRVGSNFTAALPVEMRTWIVAAAERKCDVEGWNDERRRCVVAADDLEEAESDCAGSPTLSHDELVALPPELQCEALATRAHELWNAPGGKFALILANTEHPEMRRRLPLVAAAARDRIQEECVRTPWTVAQRTCVRQSTTGLQVDRCR